MTLLKRLLAGAAIMVLMSCAAPTDPFQAAKDAERSDWKVLQERYPDPQSVQQLVARKTGRFFGMNHGTQVEYFGPDGRAYLWYPGNRNAVPARWYVRSNKKGKPVICFIYPPSSFNPVTQTSGGQPQCRFAWLFIRSARELVEGDPFKLSSLQLPFTMPRNDELTLAQLAGRAGLGAPGPDLTWWAPLNMELQLMRSREMLESFRKSMRRRNKA